MNLRSAHWAMNFTKSFLVPIHLVKIVIQQKLALDFKPLVTKTELIYLHTYIHTQKNDLSSNIYAYPE